MMKDVEFNKKPCFSKHYYELKYFLTKEQKEQNIKEQKARIERKNSIRDKHLNEKLRHFS